MKILLVEDDGCIAKILEKVLGNQNYVVEVATNGQAAWELVQAFAYDLILLDVILPKLDGINLCQRLRSHNYQTPILLLTSKNSSSDKVMGLDAGADDYVVKPFAISELLARIRVLLRRKSSPIQPVLEWENLRLDPGTCEVTYSGHTLNLTPKEYRLLELFLRNRHQVYSRSAILENLWSFEDAPSEYTVTAHIKGLRQKLKQAGAPADLIETVYGLGYRLKLPVSLLRNAPRRLPTSSPQTRKSLLQQQTNEALAGVWEKFKGQSSDRLALLEQATTALLKGTLGDELRQKAQQAAHKLAGALGVFGFAEGSHQAREIEQMFQAGLTLDQNEMLHLSELVVALQLELKRKNSSKHLPKPESSQVCPLMVVIDDDTELAERMESLAAALGVRIELASNLSVARDALAQQSLDVVLLNLCLANADEDSLALLAQLTNQTPPTPVLFFTARDNLACRVKVSQLPSHAFLQKPLLSEQLLEAIVRVLKQGRATEAKVMVVDDDPQVLAVMGALLEPWRLKLTMLDDPRRFWNILEEFSPDLLLLDVEMPHFSGIELCQVVRNDLRWSRLPVLFFTVHTDERTVYQVFTAGADDCFSKSTVGPELVTRVLNRLERVRLLQSVTNGANTNLR
jgi:DNA-binding response OmpR family regulator